MQEARNALLEHVLFKNKKAVNLNALFSIMVCMETVGGKLEFAKEVKNGLPGSANYRNKTIWASTIGYIIEKVKRKWGEDKDGSKEIAFLNALEAHLEDITKSRTAFTGTFGKVEYDGTEITAVDVRVLTEVVEVIMFLNQ